MKADELIGKRAIRSTSAEETSLSYKLTSRPVIIDKKTDTHIICHGVVTIDEKKRFEKLSYKQMEIKWLSVTETLILNSNYFDENWLSYDEVIKGTRIEELEKRENESPNLLSLFMFIGINMMIIGFVPDLLNLFNIDEQFKFLTFVVIVICFNLILRFVLYKYRKNRKERENENKN